MILIENKPIEILLIEDNPNDVELTLHAFEQNRLANLIQVVRNGAEALDFLFATGAYAGRDTQNVPKMILLDLKLPKVSGIEVLRRIRQDPRTRMIPVIALTTSHEDKDLIETYTLGVNSYILKPVEFDKFSAVVEQLGCYWLLLNQLPPHGPHGENFQ